MILLIDADDTLFDFKRSERESIIATAKKFGAADPEGAADIFTLINKACWLDVEKGIRTREQIAVDRFRELKSRLSLDADAETINEYYKAQMRNSYYLLPGAGKFLRDLKLRGYSLYLITNGVEATQKSRLEGSGIFGFFDGVFISEAMGCRKPEREFFELVGRQIKDFDPADCYVIGDSLTADIKGANAAGLKSIWFNPTGKPLTEDSVPTHQARSYSDVLNILDSAA